MNLLKSMISSALLLPSLTLACTLAGGNQVSAGSITLSYQLPVEKIIVSQPFAMEIKLCRNNSPLLPKHLRVDAGMPAHGHGMNYQPTITTLAKGHYAVDEFIFHMMGRWIFTIDVITEDEKQSFRIDYTL